MHAPTGNHRPAAGSAGEGLTAKRSPAKLFEVEGSLSKSPPRDHGPFRSKG